MKKNIINTLFEHSQNQPDKIAFCYHDVLDERNISSVTYNELYNLVTKVGYKLKEYVTYGDRVSLTLANSIEYIIAFLGVQSIGAIPVSLTAPTKQDKKAERLKVVLNNCNPITSIVDKSFTHKDILNSYINIEDLLLSDKYLNISEISINETAFLQYTSGSTSDPKGVVITHKNLYSNHLQIKESFQTTSNTIYGTWLPIFHDMGLIGKILHPIFDGSTVHAIRPESFLRNPKQWLNIISKYKVELSAAPNFAYDYCVDRINDHDDLDLSSWKSALNGSEPVSLKTIERFSEKFSKNGFKYENFYPVYGLAEATLFVTSRTSKNNINILDLDLEALKNSNVVEKKPNSSFSKKVVALGVDWGENSKTIIWNDEENRCCNESEVGEIIVSGDNCSPRYFNNKEVPSTLKLEMELINPIRTGDLGFIRNNELYITGRKKEVIILRGKNIYPEDIEGVAQTVSNKLIRHGGAAFAIETQNEQEIILIHEVSKDFNPNEDGEVLTKLIKENVAQNLRVNIENIIFIPKGKLPKTTSGKIARNKTKERFLNEFYTSDKYLYCLNNNQDKINEMSLWIDEEFTKFDFKLFDERRCITPNLVLALGNKGFFGMTASDYQQKNKKISIFHTMNFIRKISSIDLTCAALIGIHNGLVLSPLEKFGSDLQKKQWLDFLRSGRIFGSFALTESSSGSNPRSIKSKAYLNENNIWSISGEKIWIGSAGWSEVTLFFAQSYDSFNNYLGVTAFLLPTNLKGFSQSDETLTMGMRGIIQNSIILNDVKVDSSYILGEIGRGFDVIESTINFGRLGVAYMALGSMQRSLKLIADYTQKREIVGGLLIDHPLVSSKIFEISICTQSIKYIVDKIANTLDSSISVPNELLSLIKAIASELCWNSIDSLLQIFGGRGYDEANSIPQMLRDARLLRIFEGSSEALFEFVGQCLIDEQPKLITFLRDNYGFDSLEENLKNIKNEILQFGGSEKSSLVRLSNYTLGLSFSYLLLQESYNKTNNSHDLKNEAAEWFKYSKDTILRDFFVKKRQNKHFMNFEIIERICHENNDLPNWRTIKTKIKNYPNIDFNDVEIIKMDEKENIDNIKFFIKEKSDNKVDTYHIRKWILNWIKKRKNNSINIDCDKSFFEVGLDSLDAAELAYGFEDEYKVKIDPTVLWEFPTINKLSNYLVNKM
ncbi:AMP-binding protein [Acinetobacter calcoaceticus]|uniref:AMP-binding protein n=1 Tax=Acinetobacter calcoaceticus TaxID=471 RepID=UPI003009AB1B